MANIETVPFSTLDQLQDTGLLADDQILVRTGSGTKRMTVSEFFQGLTELFIEPGSGVNLEFDTASQKYRLVLDYGLSFSRRIFWSADNIASDPEIQVGTASTINRLAIPTTSLGASAFLGIWLDRQAIYLNSMYVGTRDLLGQFNRVGNRTYNSRQGTLYVSINKLSTSLAGEIATLV